MFIFMAFPNLLLFMSCDKFVIFLSKGGEFGLKVRFFNWVCDQFKWVGFSFIEG